MATFRHSSGIVQRMPDYKYQALFFDGSSERVYEGTGQTMAEAITMAHNASMDCEGLGTPPDTQDDVMSTIAFSMPDAPNVLRSALGRNCPNLEAMAVPPPYLLVWGDRPSGPLLRGQMTVPLGVIHFFPRD